MERQTTKYSKLEGGEFNMKLKHILSSLFIGSALFLIQPSLASADFKQISENDQKNFESFEDDYIQANLQNNDNNDSNQLIEDSTESDVTIDEDESMITTEDGVTNKDSNIEENYDFIEEENVMEESDIDIDEEKINQEVEINQDASDESDTPDTTSENDTIKRDEKNAEITTYSSNLKQSRTNLKEREIIQLKKDLTQLGFGKFSANPNNIYNSETRQVIKEFQAYYGLKKTGEADTITLKKISEILNSPLQYGVRHKETITLKKNLAFLGYRVPGNGTSLYGKETEKRVREFQSKNNLVVNGIGDEITLLAINNLLSIPLQNGMRREDVISLKKDLKKLGFTVPGKGTNLYGKQTEKKVRDFQQYYGLQIDGVVDNNVKNKIKEILSSPLQKGKRHKDTVKLKRNLAYIALPVPGNGTNLFGSQTENIVKVFQKKYNLVVNGIADEVTLSKLQEIISAPLKNGVRRQDVISLKEDLKKLGFRVPGKGTNLYGKQTEKKVREFQQYFGLSINGIADEITLNKIYSILNSPLQNGKRHKDTVTLKSNLKKLGFTVPGKGTNLYGKQTEKKVKDFQKKNGLAVNGIADEVTLAKINQLLKNPNSGIKIFIDPGHGGSDPGATANGLKEKDLTLDISKRVERLLISAGYNVIMTRTDDSYLALEQRSQMANDANADLFMSIHINAGGGRGIETWWNDNNSNPKESEQLASYVQSEIIKSTKAADRGVKGRGPNRGNFHVTREPNMPSALVEVGFIDTKSDADNLKNKNFLQKAAEGIANGIKKFFS